MRFSPFPISATASFTPANACEKSDGINIKNIICTITLKIFKVLIFSLIFIVSKLLPFRFLWHLSSHLLYRLTTMSLPIPYQHQPTVYQWHHQVFFLPTQDNLSSRFQPIISLLFQAYCPLR